MMKVRVGSRESSLAVIQSEIVMDAIREFDSSIETELVTMKTKGDRILDRNLDKVGGKGLFIKELEIALMEDRVDLKVSQLSSDSPYNTRKVAGLPPGPICPQRRRSWPISAAKWPTTWTAAPPPPWCFMAVSSTSPSATASSTT